MRMVVVQVYWRVMTIASAALVFPKMVWPFALALGIASSKSGTNH